MSAKFVDETVLKSSDINVDANDGVVTLKGPAASDAAKARAATIARGTEGVTRVVNQLVVRARWCSVVRANSLCQEKEGREIVPLVSRGARRTGRGSPTAGTV